MSWRQQLSVKHMKFWRTLIQLMLVAKLAACNSLPHKRCPVTMGIGARTPQGRMSRSLLK